MMLKNMKMKYIFKFKKEWWPSIIKFISWGILIGVLLPFSGEALLQHYANYSAYNSLLIEQGFKPYQTSQLECDTINREVLTDLTREAEDWVLISKISKLSSENSLEPSQENKDLLILHMKDSMKANKKFQQDSIHLRICLEKMNQDAKNLALFLKILPIYQKNYIQTQKILQKIDKAGTVYAKNMLSKLNLPIPDTMQNIDKLNDILANINQFSSDFFGDFNSDAAMKKLETLLKLNVNLRKEQVLINVKSYKIRKEFDNKNEQLFITTLQKRL